MKNQVASPSREEIDLALAEFRAGRLHEAAQSAIHLCATYPADVFGWKLHAAVLQMQGNYVEALSPAMRAAEIAPLDVEARSNLGAALQSLDRLDEAEVHLKAALSIEPTNAEANNNLGNVLRNKGLDEEAQHYYKAALRSKPHWVEAHVNVGLSLTHLHRLAEAGDAFKKALEINPTHVQARNSSNLNRACRSDYAQTVADSDLALSLDPQGRITWEQRLYCFSYHPDLSTAQIYQEFVRWGEQFPTPAADFNGHDRTPKRRLRIGYVSPDFRNHTSRFYFLPLFTNHDRAAFELFAYSNVRLEDAVTRQFKSVFDHWRPIRALDDAASAQLIRDDGIDILVDCCNHMQDDRLGIFTLKPAPIQATWLGAAWTTGLKTIDYVLTDPIMAPEGTLTSEAIIRLPHCFVAYQPPDQTAAVVVPPGVGNGYVTFGYTGRTERLNHRTFKVWGDILRQLPTARLILDFAPFADPATQAYYAQFMSRLGVDMSRVTMRRSPNIFEGLNDIDIILDCFPHSGGTMLFDALWMGVPALTLAGRPPVGMIGTSLMSNLGLPEWIARSEHEYVEKACAFANQLEQLVILRATMRERMRASPVMDGPGFARVVEDAFQMMYATWCNQKQLESSQPVAPTMPTAQENTLLDTLFTQGFVADAEAHARTLTARYPNSGSSWKMLGAILQQQGKIADALMPSEKAVQLLPTDAEALSNFGAALQSLARPSEAEHYLRRALQHQPGFAEAHNNLGNALKDQTRLTEAEQHFRAALQIKPTWAEAYSNLATTLQEMDRLDEAESHHRHALTLKPNNAGLHNNLGITLKQKGDFPGAESCYRSAIAINAGWSETHNNLGLMLHSQGRLVEARDAYLQALAIDPSFADAQGNLGVTLAYLSDFEGATSRSNLALALHRDPRVAWEQRLYSFSYHPDFSAAQIYREFEGWGERFPMPMTNFARHDRTPGRRLRIGYVSPDFRRHTSRFYFLPLFAHHNPVIVELFAYSNVRHDDTFTEQFKSVFDHWRPIRHLDDAAAAQLIRDDRIDILVDCCNHMLDDRLGVFTHKPAPIQATWLGAAWTTGLKMVDYVLTDPIMSPEGTLTSEQVVQLPHFFVAYQPPEVTAEVVPPPHRKNGYITFGYSGRTERLNHRTFKTWGEILRRLPTAKLMLDYGPFADPPTQAYYTTVMGNHGVDTSRVVMRRSVNIFEGLGDIDILLDCFPHSGGTMLFDALWMGIPALTLAGRPPVGLIGTSLMTNLGLPEWVARSEEEYVEKACIFAAQSEVLVTLRATMRERMRASPVMDGPGFARGVEDAFQMMYAKFVGDSLEDANSIIAQGLQQALSCQEAGDFTTAEALYRSILDAAPHHPIANHNLGILAVQLGDAQAGLPFLEAALEANPQQGQYWLSYIDASIKAGRHDAAREAILLSRESGLEGDVLDALEHKLPIIQEPSKKVGLKKKLPKSMTPQQSIESSVVLFQQGHLAEAETQARALIASHPKNGNGWKILGAVLQKQNRGAESLSYSHKAVQLLPNDFEALSNHGAALTAANESRQAETILRRALRLKPNHPEALNNLGNALKGQDRFAEAEKCYRTALKLRPEWPEVFGNLGFTLNKLDRLDEAESFQRRALALQPSDAILNNQLGITLKHQGQVDEAEHCYRQALLYNPMLADAHNNLGLVLQAQIKLIEARQCFMRAVEAEPAFGEGFSNLATAHAYLSDFTQVVACSDRALETGRDLRVIWEQRLYAFSYHADLSAVQIYREFERWGERFPMPATDFTEHDRTPGRRLRIGYVSPDFRRHTSRFYFMPLFANHDPTVVELFAYSNVFSEDAFTEQFKAVFDHWRPIRQLDDAAAAQLIKDDGIDILVDCCNHMQGDRLGVFTLKPAPIQATWLGAAWTTGLKMIDYVLTDPIMAPEGTLTSEQIVRLPHFFVAYQPPEETAEVVLPPYLNNGYLTFGYSGRTERLNHRTFRVWGEILQRLPTARLILDFSTFADPANQAYYTEFMAKLGMDTTRVTMRKSANIFEGLGDIDILLDCFPHSGGTMLFDALWMGVPALTLAGRPPVGLIGTSLMTNLGLPEWVAQSEEEYVKKACAFATQPEQLITLRATMRERMRASPVMDGPGFARGVENAFQGMYATWREQP